MKRLCIGILAHVDAGKTTLTEGLLYTAGALRSLGRVDHCDAFLDNETLERERGITIFSKQALLEYGGCSVTLLDTPGHADFSAEMERTLGVLDCAVLVISGSDGVQGHTRTLWRLLERYGVPTFLFINKMDLDGTDRAALLQSLQGQLSAACIDFGAERTARDDAAAMCSEAAMEQFLTEGALSDETITDLIRSRSLFPCFFGAALKLEGVEAFLSQLLCYAPVPHYGSQFGAKVFKITRDNQGTRLVHMKITGGTLRAKTLLRGGEGEEVWEHKADQLRLYSGAKFRPIEEAGAGCVVAVTGLEASFPGQGLGFEAAGSAPLLEPVLSYRLLLPDSVDPHVALPKLRQLADEDPMLRILWEEENREIHVQLMGQVQLEILQRLILDRFGYEVSFGTGGIVYKETVENSVEGVGHFEPLRHYAEVHLLIEPGERGSGVVVDSACPTDNLHLNWQRLILTHLLEREHPGVLTGSALTDVRITLIAGRAHLKHTEGGDFRQATYRAVRQGLMEAKSQLLEPFYDFRLELPPETVGRAINDIQLMGGSTEPPENCGEFALLTGFGPVAKLRDYAAEVATYTRGRGQLSCTLRGYEPCAEAAAVIDALGYDPERDAFNPTGSVFCEHGAGVYVPWDEVKERMHVESPLRSKRSEVAVSAPGSYRSAASDDELLRIFENTYGKVEQRSFEPKRSPARTSLDDTRYNIKKQAAGPEYLLVDGYNIIFAWDELRAIADEDVSAAREALVDLLANYRAFKKCEVILVFDAYKVKGNPGSVDKRSGIYVVYTKEAETADTYIERTTYDLGKNHRVRVATSDNLEQVIILGHGALRISARAFHQEVAEMNEQISGLIRQHNLKGLELRRLKNTANIQKNDETRR